MVVAVQLSVPGLYLPAGIQVIKGVIDSAPDDHLATSPDCGVTARPVGAFVVLVGVQLFVPGLYLPPVLTRRETCPLTTPDNHFGSCPYRSVARPRGRGARAVCKCPSIRRRIVPTA